MKSKLSLVLYTSLIGQGKTDEEKKEKMDFDKAWSESNIGINSSVL